MNEPRATTWGPENTRVRQNLMPSTCAIIAVPDLFGTGRVHLYEGISASVLRAPIYAMKLIGCEALLLTSAVGSLRREVGAGELVLLSDHINMQVW